MSSSSKIHRSEYVEHVEEFAKVFRRCSVETRIPRKFAVIARDCVPNQKEACEFEKIEPEEVEKEQETLSHPNLDLQFIGCGLGRCTYEFKPKCVVKFARSGRRNGEIVGGKPWWHKSNVTGEDQNSYETASYVVADDKVKDLLVPIVAHSPKPQYKWIVLPKVENYNAGDFSSGEGDDIADRLEAKLDRRGASCEDIHYNNVGRLQGEDVLLDYGFGISCSVKKTAGKRKARKLREFIPTHVSKKKTTRKTVGEWQKEAGIKKSPDEFFAGRKADECQVNSDCAPAWACIEDDGRRRCKIPATYDIDNEIHKVVLKYWNINEDNQGQIRETLGEDFRKARALQADFKSREAMDWVQAARLLVERQS